MEKTYYRGLHVFAAEGNSDYYVSYNEGRIQVIRTDHGSNPDYARESDKITLFDDISELYSKYDERSMHKELIETINSLGKTIEKRFKDIDEQTSICSRLSTSGPNLMFDNTIVSTLDKVKDEIKTDRKVDKAKKTNEFWFIRKLLATVGSNMTDKEIADFVLGESSKNLISELVKDYQEGNYEEDKKSNV